MNDRTDNRPETPAGKTVLESDHRKFYAVLDRCVDRFVLYNGAKGGCEGCAYGRPAPLLGLPTPAIFDLNKWTCDTVLSPGSCFPSDSMCWRWYAGVPLTTTCSKKAGALSAGDDDDTSGGIAAAVVNEDLTVPEREQLRSACAAFAASGNADVPASAAAGEAGTVELTPEEFASICKSVTTSMDDDTDALAIPSTASAANTADLETTILNLKISLAVVSTLLAIGILHTLHQSTMSTRAAGQAAQGKPAPDNADDGPESYASISEI